jgi:hypothetical protein
VTAEPSPWIITIPGDQTKYGTAGFDSIIVPVPEGWYADVATADGTRRALVPQVAGWDMLKLSRDGAAGVDEILHHADWVITADPDQVETLGMTHGCPDCREGTDRALAWLREHPGGEVAIGTLYWAADAPPGGVEPVEGAPGMFRRPGLPG